MGRQPVLARRRADHARTKLDEYLQLKQANRLSGEDARRREQELAQLDGELNEARSKAEYDLAAKRQALLEPVLGKLQSAIDDVAKAGGYTLVLNETTSAGVSTILYGPPEDDLTERIMAKLGIPQPKEER